MLRQRIIPGFRLGFRSLQIQNIEKASSSRTLSVSRPFLLPFDDSRAAPLNSTQTQYTIFCKCGPTVNATNAQTKPCFITAVPIEHHCTPQAEKVLSTPTCSSSSDGAGKPS